MIEIILLLACCCFVFIVVLAGWWFLNRGEEGDECEGKDENGTYEIDEDLKCVLKSCDTGYYKSGKKCLVDQSGVVCVPIGTPDPQGTYLTTTSNVCTLSSCATGYYKSGKECLADQSDPEVFYVGGYDYTKVQAAATCTTHGAVVATGAQLAAAQVAEADWCATGWLSDQTVAKYPINTSIMAGCGNGTPGIKAWTPPNGMAGVNCYGVKPDEGTEKVSRFNTAKWSRHD